MTPHPAGWQKFFLSLLVQNADQNMKWQELLHANRGRASWYNPLENILAFFFFFLFQLKSKVCPSDESVILQLFIFLGWGMKIDKLYSYTEAHKKNIDHNKGDTREYMKYYFMHAFH